MRESAPLGRLHKRKNEASGRVLLCSVVQLCAHWAGCTSAKTKPAAGCCCALLCSFVHIGQVAQALKRSRRPGVVVHFCAAFAPSGSLQKRENEASDRVLLYTFVQLRGNLVHDLFVQFCAEEMHSASAKWPIGVALLSALRVTWAGCGVAYFRFKRLKAGAIQLEITVNDLQNSAPGPLTFILLCGYAAASEVSKAGSGRKWPK